MWSCIWSWKEQNIACSFHNVHLASNILLEIWLSGKCFVRYALSKISSVDILPWWASYAWRTIIHGVGLVRKGRILVSPAPSRDLPHMGRGACLRHVLGGRCQLALFWVCLFEMASRILLPSTLIPRAFIQLSKACNCKLYIHGASGDGRWNRRRWCCGYTSWWRRIRKIQCPNKVKMFIWRFAHSSLAVRANLVHRGIGLEDTRCLFCRRFCHPSR